MALLPAKKGAASRGSFHAAARQRLVAADPALRSIIARVGPCTLTPRLHYFTVLCDSIVSQQLSTAVAEAIFERFTSLYPRRRPTPEAVSRTTVARLRSIGLSAQKAAYVKDLAAGFRDGRIRPKQLVRQSNDEIIEALVSVRGIGRWTAEMFLIFRLGRLDVLPVDDHGVRKAMQRAYGFRELPKAERMRRLAERWRPYRTVGSWYLWRSLAVVGGRA